MSDTYTPNSANNQPNVTLPEDGEPLDVASYRVGAENLKDQIAHILNGVTTFAGIKSFAATALNFLNNMEFAFAFDWTINVDPQAVLLKDGGAAPSFSRCVTSVAIDQASNANHFPVANTLAIGATYLFPITELPDRCEVTGLSIVHNPNDATAPTAKVKLGLLKIAKSGSGPTDAITPIEDPATGSGYTNAHTFTATFGSPVFVELDLYSYWVKVISETGGSAIPGTIGAQPVISYNATYLDLGK